MFFKALPETLEAGGVTFEVMTKGAGRPLLYLHAGHGVDADDPLVARLSERFKVIAASHPGFGTSTRPASVTTVDDLAYAYLDLAETLDLDDAILVGVSFGAWIAAEIAIKGSRRFSHVVLADPLGAKFGDRETRDVVDIFSKLPDELPKLLFADGDAGRAAFGNFDFVNQPEQVAYRVARNREALVLFGWAPTLYDPKLAARLRRIGAATLVLHGSADRFTAEGYARRFAGAIPGAAYEEIEGAGHYGAYEKPDAYAAAIAAFLDQSSDVRVKAA